MAKDYLGAVQNKDLSRFRHAIDEEASELSDFARALKARTETCPNVFDRLIDDMNIALRGARFPVDAETALEACGRRSLGLMTMPLGLRDRPPQAFSA